MRGGEDALYADKDLLIVSDGVGGWADRGINPGNWARALVSLAKDLFYSNQVNYS